MSNQPLREADLVQFTGTEQWYRHGLVRRILYTDGAKYVADKGGAYWLLDEIATSQLMPKIAQEEFQVWKLEVDQEKSTALLTCGDGDGNVVFKKKIEFTDFPLAQISLWCVNNTIHLPSEY